MSAPTTTAKDTAARGLSPRRLKLVYEHVEHRLGEKLTLVELARTAGLSAHHFATAFRSATGISPHRYVLQHRIVRATELLRETRLPISEIALRVGFSSQSHFTAIFRRSTGRTPARFRQALE